MKLSPHLQLTDGWYGEEHDGAHPFRWMQKEASCLWSGGVAPGVKYLYLTAGHSFGHEAPPRLEIFAEGKKIGEKTIARAFSSYLASFEAEGGVRFDLKLDSDRQVCGDPRKFGIMIRRLEVISPEEIEEPVFGDGWTDLESGEFYPFRWMSKEANIILPARTPAVSRFMTLPISSEFMNMTQALTVRLRGKVLAETALLNRWNYYSIPLSPDQAYSRILPSKASSLKPADRTDAPGSPFEMSLSLNKLYPVKYHPQDRRELGARIGIPLFHNNEDRHRDFVFFHENALLNFQEMTEGKTALMSFPVNLGVDLYGKCNIKPPCVYCLWEAMKALEGDDADAVVDKAALEQYGPFIKAARSVVNCSFGEPLIHPQFEDIMEFLTRSQKIIELSTNGQAFTERTIRSLVGKPVNLYVSLDAATKETYAKIRNDKWDVIVPNLMKLAEERRKAGGLPKIFMVFIPMRVNRGDLEEYFRLSRMIGADSLVLRPLTLLEHPRMERDRGGYHFDYEKELLSKKEIEDIIKKSEEYSRIYGVLLANQFHFGITPRQSSGENASNSESGSDGAPKQDRA